jgi:molybdenum cofactor cytidylyltransferase
MISSVRIGIRAMQSSTGVFIVPVDHPFVAAETYRTLRKEFFVRPDVIVKPSYRKQSGHPVVIPVKLYNTIISDKQNFPLRRLLKESGIPWIFIDVDDPGVVKNINDETDVPGNIARRNSG